MKKKRYILRAVQILSLLLVLLVSLALLQEYVLCHADHNRQRLKGFYEEDVDSLDVVYLGASDVYSDIAPGYAYARDGITGYLFASQANSILNYKSQLKNILSRQKNALIVIELNGALYDNEEDITKEANLRNYSDNVPLDPIKAEWVWENVKENKAEYLFPLIKYHGNWSDLEDGQKYRRTIINDKLRGYNYLKGVLNWTVEFECPFPAKNAMLPSMAQNKKPLTEISEKGLRDLLQFCKDEGLKNVVFARFPHIVTERTLERFERGNTMGDIVAEYGFDYLNFEKDFAQIGLDITKDFYNLDHLNVHGQKKFTAFLTDYLKEHYALTARELSEKQKEEWDVCADYYEAYYQYNVSMMNSSEAVELSEDCELIEALKDYLPE